MLTSRTMSLLGAVALTTAAMLAPTSATAAPQILAVAASSSPMPFHCEDGVCEIEVSAMCLQENRRFPDSQTVYTPHEDQSFTLVFETAEGEQRRVIAGDLVTIRSKRSFTAVKVAFPEEALADMGTESVSLQIAGGASLIPAEEAHDFYPQTETDIAHATGPLRELAAGWLDAGGDRAEASQLVSQVLNTLPDEDELSANAFETAWTVAEDQRRDEMTPGALEYARTIYEQCQDAGASRNYRQCLEKGHDTTLYRMNVEYWAAVKAGS